MRDHQVLVKLITPWLRKKSSQSKDDDKFSPNVVLGGYACHKQRTRKKANKEEKIYTAKKKNFFQRFVAAPVLSPSKIGALR